MANDSVLHGVLTQDGRIAHISPPIPVAILRSRPVPDDPDQVMRFAGRCAEGACSHWATTADRCSLVDSLTVDVVAGSPVELPVCGIRPDCRWYRQVGASACEACSHVTRSIARPEVPAQKKLTEENPMATLPEPYSNPVETTAATADPFYGSLVVIDDRQTFMIVVDGLKLDPAKVQEIEGKLQGVVADALVEHALEVQPLDEDGHAA